MHHGERQCNEYDSLMEYVRMMITIAHQEEGLMFILS